MANTLYASFADRDQAVKAAGALLDHGVRNDDLSIIAHGEEHEVDAYTSSLASYRASDPVLIDPAVGPATTGNAGSHVGSVSNSDDHTDDTDDGDDAEGSAKHGLSTTSGEDAAAGAAKGAGVGLGVGAALAIASLFVPGVGLVVGGGALATALGGAALTTGAGAIAGGVTGYLKDQGVPAEVVEQYGEVVAGGGAVVSVALPSGDVDEAQARELFGKYSASNVGAYGMVG